MTGILYSIGEVFTLGWWIIVPLILFYILQEVWLFYVRKKFTDAIKWTTIEVRVPRSVLKSPKSMEQVFAAVHGTYTFGIKFYRKWFKGEVEKWMAFEIVGFSGGAFLYIRLPQEFRNLIESAIYSQYPDAEITPADSYLDALPSTLPNQTYDLFGTELSLTKEAPFPIRTYEFFEEQKDEWRIDPLASVFEVMAGLKEGEVLLLQICARPTGDKWRKEGEELIDAMRGKKKEKKSFLEDWIEGFFEFLKNFSKAPVEYPAWAEPKIAQKGEIIDFQKLSPIQKEMAEGITQKISKVGFEVTMRSVYIDHRSAFTRSNVAALTGALRQFNSQTLNGLRVFRPSLTRVRGLFKARRVWARKKKLFRNYRRARMNKNNIMILNTEELATLFHFPIQLVVAPALRRVESRTGGAPTGLPTEE
ncbi:MAG: hypothetical protein HYS43_01810 [Candidatus Liptonbacteria bacterium]|nr:hypothetical protein [Candidatus Liptonbacteria bacterium]